MRNWKVHAEYLIWAMWAVKRANDEWRARRPYPGEVLMTREGFDSHLFHWGVGAGLIPDPGPGRDMPPSYYVAMLYQTHMEAVQVEARNYWRLLLRGRRLANAQV